MAHRGIDSAVLFSDSRADAGDASAQCTAAPARRGVTDGVASRVAGHPSADFLSIKKQTDTGMAKHVSLQGSQLCWFLTHDDDDVRTSAPGSLHADHWGGLGILGWIGTSASYSISIHETGN
jgi:hypothetical protein